MCVLVVYDEMPLRYYIIMDSLSRLIIVLVEKILLL